MTVAVKFLAPAALTVVIAAVAVLRVCVFILAFFGLFRVGRTHREIYSLFLSVNADNAHANDFAHGKSFGRVLYIIIRNFGNMNESVVMNSYIHERAEVDNVAHGPRKLHTFFKVFYVHKVGS